MVYKASESQQLLSLVDQYTVDIDNQLRNTGKATFRTDKLEYAPSVINRIRIEVTKLYTDAGWRVKRESGGCDMFSWDYLEIVLK